MAFQPFFPEYLTSETACQNSVVSRESIVVSSLAQTELVQNDTGPQLLMTLRDTNTSELLDLSRVGTEIQFNFSTGPNDEVKAVIPMIPGPDAENGEVMLDWSAGTSGALDTVGTYYGEVQITWPEGRIQTTPAKLKFRIRGELG